MRKIFTREFVIGFLVATVFWAGIASEITVPEYTIEHRTVCT